MTDPSLLYWAMQVYLYLQKGNGLPMLIPQEGPMLIKTIEFNPMYNDQMTVTDMSQRSWIPGNYKRRRGKR